VRGRLISAICHPTLRLRTGTLRRRKVFVSGVPRPGEPESLRRFHHFRKRFGSGRIRFTTHGAIADGSTQAPVVTRVRLFGVEIDAVRMQDAADRVVALTQEKGKPCQFVVTPNVDHVLLLQDNDGLRRAYADASLVIADGWPVVFASQLLGKPLPERVPGSDIVPAIFGAVSGPLRVFLLGAGPGVAERARQRIHDRWHRVQVTGVYSPPLGFENDAAENESILQRIEAASPDLLLIGLGAPKQELWVHKHRERIKAPAALCIGATIDFIAGEKPRAPRWVQRVGFEWFHRMMSEPKRLLPRYARNAVTFPGIVVREWRGGRPPSSPGQ
jgi:N-acetylglucosaminyldiphosphoundecaprenol N-acetyl-beta-D-mannosaminyltransferase